MAKQQRKARAALKARVKSFDLIRNKKGFKQPGSLNLKKGSKS